MGKTYNFTFIAKSETDNLINSDYTFTVEVPINLPPKFKTPLFPQTVTAGTTFEWELPELKDPDGEAIALINVKLGMAGLWM